MRLHLVGIFTLIGLGGFALYLAPYALLQLGRLDGNGHTYTVANVVAASMVLVSMIEQFNLASAMIQATWIGIGLGGMVYKAYKVSRSTIAPLERSVAGSTFVRDSATMPTSRPSMEIDWVEHERILLDRVRRGDLSEQALSGVLQDLVAPAVANSVDHVRLLITLLDAAPALRSAISALVLNAHDVDDVLQETLLAVSHALPSYRGDAPVLTWAKGIARNKAKDVLRQKGRAAAPLPQPNLAYEQERFTSQWATRTDVDDAVATLSPKLRAVFELADLDGLSYHEIATKLGIERNTVASRLRRARAQLQLLVAVGTAHN